MTNKVEISVSYKDEYEREWYISSTIPATSYHSKECIAELLKSIGEALSTLV